MSVNRYRPHVYVLPEDDANREIANGFLRHPSLRNHRQVQVMPNARGWSNALDKFRMEYIRVLSNKNNSHVFLLIDFDYDGGRRGAVESVIPEELRDRAFVIGAWSNPEALRQATPGSFRRDRVEARRKLSERFKRQMGS